MTKNILLVTTALSALALSSGFAHAADAAAAANANTASTDTTVGEIVVTAEKREANLQEVPEAVTAFTAKDRNIKGISTIQDITNYTPGLTYSSQLDRPAMRGLARSTNTYTADSSVAIYYDDFFSNSTFLVGRDDMLIDQVEVLLGPQGTLYGRNSIGGLINTKSRLPTSDYSGEFRVILGNYQTTKYEGTVSGPVPGIPNLTFRASGYYDAQQQGYLYNTYPGAPSEGGVRHDPYGDFQLQYKTDKDNLWADFNVLGFNDDRGGPGSLLGTPTVGPYDTAQAVPGQITFNPGFGYATPQSEFIPYSAGAEATGPIAGSVVGALPGGNPSTLTNREFAHNISTRITVDKDFTFQFHWIHHFDGFDVKYVGGYSQYHYELHTALFANDDSTVTSYQVPLFAANGTAATTCANIIAFYGAGCSPLTVNPSQQFNFTTQTDWSSHEITISSTTNKPLQWIAGVYYYWETDNNPITVNEPDQPQIKAPIQFLPLLSATPAFVPAIANPSGDYYYTNYQDRIQSIAGYAQVDWKITPTLKFTGGIRYTADWKHAQEETRYVLFDNGVLNPSTFGSLTPAIDFTPALISEQPGQGICSIATLATTGPYAGDDVRCLKGNSSAVTGTAGFEWTPDDNTLAYVRYNRGYKAFALNAGFNGPNPEVQPESVNDYEIGFKKTVRHNLTLDIDAFYYDYANDQVPLAFIAPGTLGGALGIALTEFINIPSAVSEGIEFTGDWRPLPRWDINVTYGLDRTVITSGCTTDANGNAVGACYRDPLDGPAVQPGARPVGKQLADGSFYQAVNGNALPQAPENKLAVNTNYTWVFNPGNLTLSATYVWRDKEYSTVFTRSYNEAPLYGQVDMRAVWSGHHDRYEVVLYVRNLFNDIGYDAASSGYYGLNNQPVSAYDLTPPRTYGVELHYKF